MILQPKHSFPWLESVCNF